MYIYIYIYTYVHIHIHSHTYVYIYIYIIHTQLTQAGMKTGRNFRGRSSICGTQRRATEKGIGRAFKRNNKPK